MSETLDLSLEGVERRSLADFTEQAYLNYSMYVIMTAPYRTSATASSRYSGESSMP